jgi:hypothetical protein
MERDSTNLLPIRHVSAAGKKFLDYVKKRKEGLEPALKTGFSKIDKALMNGIE